MHAARIVVAKGFNAQECDAYEASLKNNRPDKNI
jgi:hypothetical protein